MMIQEQVQSSILYIYIEIYIYVSRINTIVTK